jgi:hypothetical protein
LGGSGGRIDSMRAHNPSGSSGLAMCGSSMNATKLFHAAPDLQ